MFLYHAGERTGAHLLIIALLGEPSCGLIRKLDNDLTLGKLRLELHDELLNDLAHDLGRQMAEADRRIEPVAEWRSIYSDISKRMRLTPRTSASRRATSVLPTPVGPENR